MNILLPEIEEFISVMKRVDISKVFDVDLSSSEIVLLRTVSDISKDTDSDVVYVSDIVDGLSVSAQAVSKLFKNLESKNYIERHTNRDDRRRTEVKITPEGKAEYDKVCQKTEELIDGIFKGFSADEIEQFVSLIRKFRELYTHNIEEMMRAHG